MDDRTREMLQRIETLDTLLRDRSAETMRQADEAEARGVFEEIGGRPADFVPQSRLLLRHTPDDDGARPLDDGLDHRGSSCLRLVDSSHFDPSDRRSHVSQGTEVDNIGQHEPFHVEVEIANTGHMDAIAAVCELFLGVDYRRRGDPATLPADVFVVEDVARTQTLDLTGRVVSGRFEVGDVLTLPDGRTVRLGRFDLISGGGPFGHILPTGARVTLRFSPRVLNLAMLPEGLPFEMTGRGSRPGQPGYERDDHAPVFVRSKDATGPVRYVDARHLDVPPGGTATARFHGWVPDLSGLRREGWQLHAARVYARVLCFAPEDLPSNMGSLDPLRERHCAISHVIGVARDRV